MVRVALCMAVAAWMALGSAPVLAAESAPVRSERVVATLVSGTDAVVPGQPFRLALRFRMAPGWHTYWQNPGDAGAPAELTVEGAAIGPIAWPTPERLPEGPVMSYGYTGEVLLPVTATANGGRIEASATWLVCERICVPEEGRFTLDLPAGTPGPSAEAPLFMAADARTPRPSPFEARVAPGGALSLRGEGLGADTVRDAWFFPTAWGTVEHAAAQPLSVQPGAVTLALKPGSAFVPTKPLEGTLVLRDKGGQDSFLHVSAAPGGVPAADATPLWRALLLAFAGGLVLNLMPCVFPVLAMKAVAVSRMSGQARRDVRVGALAYTGGVLAAFMALGGALLAARAAGSAAGWGFQFQSPVFVAAMAWVMFAVGLNLSGVYGISTKLAGAGQGLTARGGHAGSFFTGLLAVLVATPCTAPFMGTAIAAALAAPAAVTMGVFAVMGLGLAAPYALLAFAPGLAQRLPKPGPWMEVLRGALAFPMYAAVAWLVWVLSLQAGPGGVLGAVAGLVLVGFAAWAFGLQQRGGGRVGQLAAVAAVVAALALLPGLSGTSAAPAAQAAGTEPYSATRLASLRAEGRPVFVNMTAAWCVTCLVNERVALSPDSVRRAFTERNVAYLKGDWTRGDPEITAYLRSHARDGVPLYVFYPPSGPAEVLPQILTEGAVLDRINQQGG